MKIKTLIYAALSVVFITICSWLSFPLVVPITLQTFAIAFVCVMFDLKVSLLAIVAYILLGLVGVPVFSSFNSGVGAVVGATGGFILGFIPFAIVLCVFNNGKNKNLVIRLIGGLIALFLLYSIGVIWYAFIYAKADVMTAISVCVLPFVAVDIVKITCAFLLSDRLKKHINL